jgi:hypothetical protein
MFDIPGSYGCGRDLAAVRALSAIDLFLDFLGNPAKSPIVVIMRFQISPES